MTDDINVIVVDRGRKYLYLRYTDPVTGQKVEKSSGTASKREAIKRAGEWQRDLQNGVFTSRNSLGWEEFKQAYADFAMDRLAEGTVAKIFCMYTAVDETMKPDSVRRMQPQWITRFQSELLKLGRQPSTVESHCRHLKAALNWAKSQGMIQIVPAFPRLKKSRAAKMMKGRPITLEEFERMLAVVEQLSERQRVSVKFLLRGLWLSGLRLGEALCLTWDQWADGIRVDASGEHVKLMIPCESEKGGKDRVYPVTPDFAELLLSVPEEDRSGFVFNPVAGRGLCRSLRTISKVISRLGEAAGVKVDEKDGKAKFASAHDLRRAFGSRWARRVPSVVLKDLMRHESVLTSEKYYVDLDADSTAKMLASLMPKQVDTFVDTSSETATTD